jgi:MYXO-CTERM domain-containing protein
MSADKGDDAVGPDWALIEVDDGEDAVEIEVDIEILERSCGCATQPSRRAGTWILGVMALAGIASRRRYR